MSRGVLLCHVFIFSTLFPRLIYVALLAAIGRTNTTKLHKTDRRHAGPQARTLWPTLSKGIP